jgi:DNA-binding MarR family transcriptional regulator
MEQATLTRESVEYLEILADVFAELVTKVSEEGSRSNGDITPSLAQCLEYLYLHGPSPIRKIAAGLSITVPAVSQLVERLVGKNLVTREHSSNDRRLALVELTEAGSEWIRQARSSRMEWLRTILRRMSADQRHTLVDSLEEFIRIALEERGHFDEACVRCGIDHLAFCVVSRAHQKVTGEPLEKY